MKFPSVYVVSLAGLAWLAQLVAVAAPLEDGKWERLEAFSDEFAGKKLDRKKWLDHDPDWKGHKPSYFARDNVKVEDGRLKITMREQRKGEVLPKGYHSLTCGVVKSKKQVLYGFFEIRCKPMNSRGSSSFWFYNHEPKLWTEIDVFEMSAGAPKHRRSVHMNAHVHISPDIEKHWQKSRTWTAPSDLADSFRTYGFHWTKDHLSWYIEGKLVRRLANKHWHQPLHLMMDSEALWEWFGMPQKENLPSVYEVEYVRAWRQKS